jgi:heme/copper-type cytochrome/quinol oxidase subunit 4
MMKLFRFLAHPNALIISFLMILISGEQTGGFYIIYLLTGLPYGIFHAVLGSIGVVCLLISQHLNYSKQLVIKQSLNLIGLGLMLASLVYFFKNDTKHYNWGTFEQGLPMFTIFFTGFIALCFLVGMFWHPQQKQEPKQSVLSKV